MPLDHVTLFVFSVCVVSRMREQTGVDWLGLGVCCREEEAEVVVGVGGAHLYAGYSVLLV